MIEVHTEAMSEPGATLLAASAPATRKPTSLRIPRTVGFVAMSAALLAFFVAAGAPTPLLPLYEAEWHFAPSVLTIAFGVYAFAMIAALLVAGSLSDHIGRRPLLIGALALEFVAMGVFLFSPSIWWIVIARVLQGIATGIASSTFGAAIVELAPERSKKLGAVMSSSATTAGLGLGALFSGLVALAIPTDASHIVWIALIALMAVGTLVALVTPETSTRRPGALASLVPNIAVPPEVRRLFAVTTPTIVATFLSTALFLGLVPTILATVFGVTQPIVGGLVNFVMFGVATVVATAASGVHPHSLKTLGNIGTVVGALLIIGGVATHAVALIWIAAIVSGAGLGAAFSGSNRGLVPEVKPHERAGLFAAIFTVAYLVFGGSAIAAGFIAGAVGVAAMTTGFAIAEALVALLGIALGVGLVRRRRTQPVD